MSLSAYKEQYRYWPEALKILEDCYSEGLTEQQINVIVSGLRNCKHDKKLMLAIKTVVANETLPLGFLFSIVTNPNFNSVKNLETCAVAYNNNLSYSKISELIHNDIDPNFLTFVLNVDKAEYSDNFINEILSRSHKAQEITALKRAIKAHVKEEDLLFVYTHTTRINSKITKKCINALANGLSSEWIRKLNTVYRDNDIDIVVALSKTNIPANYFSNEVIDTLCARYSYRGDSAIGELINLVNNVYDNNIDVMTMCNVLRLSQTNIDSSSLLMYVKDNPLSEDEINIFRHCYDIDLEFIKCVHEQFLIHPNLEYIDFVINVTHEADCAKKMFDIIPENTYKNFENVFSYRMQDDIDKYIQKVEKLMNDGFTKEQIACIFKHIDDVTKKAFKAGMDCDIMHDIDDVIEKAFKAGIDCDVMNDILRHGDSVRDYLINLALDETKNKELDYILYEKHFSKFPNLVINGFKNNLTIDQVSLCISNVYANGNAEPYLIDAVKNEYPDFLMNIIVDKNSSSDVIDGAIFDYKNGVKDVMITLKYCPETSGIFSEFEKNEQVKPVLDMYSSLNLSNKEYLQVINGLATELSIFDSKFSNIADKTSELYAVRYGEEININEPFEIDR